MKTYDVHICLVSGQPLPNLIPALVPEGRPREIVLLVSRGMQKQAALLAQNFINLGCKVAEVEISPYHLEEIRSTLHQVMTRYEQSSVALNTTGGTKIMVMAAYDVFRELGRPAFYVDTDNGQIIDILPQSAMSPLPDLVKVKTYLSAYGYEIKNKGSCRIPLERQDLCDHLVANTKHYADALPALNTCASAAEKIYPPCAPIEERHLNSSAFQELISRFSTAGVVHLSHNQLYFNNEEARRFAGGCWLEDHVVKVINRLKGEKLVHDHLCNVVMDTRAGVRNEIDIAFTAGNRLHLIECKSGKLSAKEGKETRADGVAYKLDNIRDLVGGTFGKAMLVSFQALNGADQKRCAENRIELVEGEQLAHLEAKLRHWILGQRRPGGKSA